MLNANFDKTAVRGFVRDQISAKIKTMDFYLNFTLEASRDIKKTAKYDSFREEIQEEIYHLDKQMFTLKKMQKDFLKILAHKTEIAQLGSIVVTNKARFYISVGLGEFFFNNERFYAISPESPMAQIMLGKGAGEEFTLNKIHQKIETIL